jgi:hypothetical protein
MDGTQEYLWWSQGATDEADARNEGLSHEIQDVRTVLEDLARLHKYNPADLISAVARIYCPDRLRRRYR